MHVVCVFKTDCRAYYNKIDSIGNKSLKPTTAKWRRGGGGGGADAESWIISETRRSHQMESLAFKFNIWES